MDLDGESFEFRALDLCDSLLANELLFEESQTNVPSDGAIPELLDSSRTDSFFNVMGSVSDHDGDKTSIATKAELERAVPSVPGSPVQQPTENIEAFQSNKGDESRPELVVPQVHALDLQINQLVDESCLTRRNTDSSVQTSSRLPMDHVDGDPQTHFLPLCKSGELPVPLGSASKENRPPDQLWKEQSRAHTEEVNSSELMPLAAILSPNDPIQSHIVPLSNAAGEMMCIQPSEIASPRKCHVRGTTELAMNWNARANPFSLIRKASGLSGFSESCNSQIKTKSSPSVEHGIQPKLRYSEGASASHYCHICGRASNTAQLAACANVRIGLCRKTLCEKCLLVHQRDIFEWAKEKDTSWTCTHCRGVCPKRARCHQYQRNNMRRRLKNGSDANKEKKSSVKKKCMDDTKANTNHTRLGVEDIPIKKNSIRSQQTGNLHTELLKEIRGDGISPTGVSNAPFGPQ